MSNGKELFNVIPSSEKAKIQDQNDVNNVTPNYPLSVLKFTSLERE